MTFLYYSLLAYSVPGSRALLSFFILLITSCNCLQVNGIAGPQAPNKQLAGPQRRKELANFGQLVIRVCAHALGTVQ